MHYITYHLFIASQYIPHGHCYLWQMPLIWLHILADGLIAISYYMIPIALIYFVRHRTNLPFRNIIILFSAFILACGTNHLIEIATLWYPSYWLSGGFKAITALISLYTALTLIPLIPQALKLPSASELENLNQKLTQQIVEKEAAETEINLLNQELNKRVAQRTSALTLANRDLQKSTRFNQKITESTPNILYIYDLQAKQNIYCNPFVYDLLGYSPREIQNFKNNLLNKLIHPDDLELIEQHFENCLTLESDSYLEIEYRLKHRSGNYHWVCDRNTIFETDDDGKPRQILGIAVDITAQKQIQHERDNLNKQLAKQVKILKERDLQRIKLAEMNAFLQACMSLQEAEAALSDFLQPLFPNCNGAVYLINSSKKILQAIATWGTVSSELVMETHECWGLRKGNVHLSLPDKPRVYCSHIHGDRDNNLNPTICLPMIAQGQTLGLFYLSLNHSDTLESTRSLAEDIAQNLGTIFNNLKLQENLRYQSLRDGLTGLYNRRYLEESLSNEIERARRKQYFIGVIMLDVDRFKRFNDTYGHEVGDFVLKEVGNYILQQTRQYDIACRYGGEELTIIMPDALMENTIIRAEEIRQGIKQLKLEYKGKHLEKITVSAGVSCFPDDGTDAENLLRVADKALYKAKKQGRDRVVRG